MKTGILGDYRVKLYTEVMTRDLYYASALMSLGAEILAVGRYYPVIRINLRVNRLSLWYVHNIGVLPYRWVKRQREYLKTIAKEHKPTKEEIKVRKLYRRNFNEAKSSNE